ncbi:MULTISPECIES: efflux transporter outer membrane subunit [Rhodanobacter]|uniref:efflux transporter outer membrane subunit n=2 Tax=Rhodanobacteraceae TaxID=1775411 RepID=UPI000910C202|nr:efflux transporter outer membrane subunit [Rhodanobacter thiooxydans]UJJ56374.1 efflux transporter outer membrane subunit [Rhodanobacter thiooxydans]
MNARAYRFAACLATAVLVAGCAVGPDYRRPALPPADAYLREPLPATISGAGDSQRLLPGTQASAAWWRAYGSPQLDALVARALTHNPSLDGARAALRVAQENLAAQRAAFLPNVQLGYSASRQRNAVGTLSPALTSGQPMYTLHTAQLTVGYAPDVFGLNRRTTESLAAQAQAQRLQLEAVRQALAANVVAAAVQEASLRAQIAATEGIVADATRALALVRRQVELGGASGLDAAAQEIALAQARAALPVLQKQEQQNRDLLAVLAGEPPAQANEPPFALDRLQLPRELPVALPATLVERRPDVRAAEAEVHAASAQVGVAVASRFPQFSLSAQYGGSATAFDRMFASGNTFWSLTGGVAQTVLDFGALKHRQRAAEAALQQAVAQYRGTVLAAFQNVADALYALDADARAAEAAASAESAARRTLELTRRQQQAGQVGGLAVLVAEQAWQQTRIAAVQMQATRHADTAALFLALGGDWRGNTPKP